VVGVRVGKKKFCRDRNTKVVLIFVNKDILGQNSLTEFKLEQKMQISKSILLISINLESNFQLSKEIFH
jgi:hypothetical protein